MSKKRSLIYETVLEHLKARLSSGQLGPGSRLPNVSDLADELGLGIASVREAYRVLETLGVVSVVQGRGTFVSETFSVRDNILLQIEFAQKQTIAHLFETRKLLEPEIAALAARRASSEAAQGILEAAKQMETLYQAGQDYIEPDVHFHELIIYAAQNPVLTKIMMALDNLLLDSRRLTSNIPHAAEKAIHFHKLIAYAICEGDADTARTLMHQHIVDVERSLLESKTK